MEGRCSLVYLFFNDTATTEIYTLSLHVALPISLRRRLRRVRHRQDVPAPSARAAAVSAREPHHAGPPRPADRKSTRLNSSHANTSYAVFCLKKNNSGILCTEYSPQCYRHRTFTY